MTPIMPEAGDDIRLETADWAGDLGRVLAIVLPLLDRRDDPLCAAAARLLRAQDEAAAAPGALAAALDRLVALVERQEAQIAALRAMIETEL